MPQRASEIPQSEAADAELPSTNALAVLGLLTVAPMTAYAIAEQTSRAFGSVWSASRRLLLGEPKRLARRGLVESIKAAPGSRAGQRWLATDAGREMITRWLATPVAPTEINAELALRLIFADQGDVGTLRRQVDLRMTQLRAEMTYCLGILDDFVATGGPFPHRLHITTATSQFIAETKLAEHAFLTWLLDELEHWPDTRTPDPDRHRASLLAMRERVAPLLEDRDA